MSDIRMKENHLLQQRVEEASLNAWPALQLKLYDGWLLKYAKGYTKRANSVNVVSDSTIDLYEKVAVSERFYADKELPPVFRLTSFNAPDGLDDYLAELGYRQVDPTHVMVLDLTEWRSPPRPTVVVRDEPLAHWLDQYCRLSGSDAGKQLVHGEILWAISAHPFFSSLAVDGRTVVCGLGVLEEAYFGLFDLVTLPDERNKGYGTQLITSLLNRAAEQGATHAYLQVVGNNTGARRLYERLGFKESYHYWYRTR